METVEFKLCTNCKRDILANNYVMHNIHCLRNLIVCPKCDEPVPITDLSDHNKEMHAKVKCSDCSSLIEMRFMDTHKKDSCSSRLVSCKICSMDVPAHDVNSHEYYCGTRTEMCTECGEIVMLKYMELHLDSNHSFLKLDDEPGPSASWLNSSNHLTNNSSFSNGLTKPLSKIPNHNQDPRPVHFNRVSPVKRNNDQPQINTAQCFAKLPNKKSTIPRKDDPIDDLFCGLHVGNISSQSRNIESYNSVRQSRSSASHHSSTDEFSNLSLPCEFCFTMVPANELVLHETGCRPDLFASNSKSEQPNRNTTQDSDSEDDMDDFDKIPCEFCEMLLPPHKLNSHHIRCNFAKVMYPSSDFQVNQLHETVPVNRKVPNRSAASFLNQSSCSLPTIRGNSFARSNSCNVKLSNYDKKQSTLEGSSSSNNLTPDMSCNRTSGVIPKPKAGRINNLTNRSCQVTQETQSTSSTRPPSISRLDNLHFNRL